MEKLKPISSWDTEKNVVRTYLGNLRLYDFEAIKEIVYHAFISLLIVLFSTAHEIFLHLFWKF